MNIKATTPILIFSMMVFMTSCVSKKKFTSLQSQYDESQAQLADSDAKLADFMRKYEECESSKEKMKKSSSADIKLKNQEIVSLQDQVNDLKQQRAQQTEIVKDLTVLTQSANDNIKNTLGQLESKDKYVRMLQAAKSKTDSINLALAVNLKSSLSEGLSDQDVEVSVDKTVVMINLSDKMLYSSGSSKLSSRANMVLGKIAKILQARPNFEVMVEGNTDDVPIKNGCLDDNWDLSVKRATSIVRKLQQDYGVDPSRLIASGRGEYSPLTSNETKEGRSRNRRTRIVIMPKLDEFYDLLDPSKAEALK